MQECAQYRMLRLHSALHEETYCLNGMYTVPTLCAPANGALQTILRTAFALNDNRNERTCLSHDGSPANLYS